MQWPMAKVRRAKVKNRSALAQHYALMPMPLVPEGSTGHGFPDQHFHRERWAGDKLLDGAGRDAADTVGLAPVEVESELVEIGLQVFRFDRAGMRAEQPALQQ